MLSNCGVGESSWESLRLKEIKPGNPKGNQPSIFIGRTDAEAEAPVLWPPDVTGWLIQKDLDAGKMEGRRRREWWDGWMASPTQWIWVWTGSWRWWRRRKPGVLQSLGSQRVGHDWATEQQYLIRLPGGLSVKNPPASSWDASSVSRSGRAPENEAATHSGFLAGKSHGQRSLVGYSPWGCKESCLSN